MSIYNKAKFYQELGLDPNRNYSSEDISQHLRERAMNAAGLNPALVIEEHIQQSVRNAFEKSEEPETMTTEVITEAPAGEEEKEIIGEYKEAPSAGLLKDSEPEKGETLTPKKTAKKKKA